MDAILTWDTFFKDKPLVRHAKLRAEAHKRGVELPEAVQVADISFRAIVNAGRWGIMCPWCGGGEFAREDRLHMCQSCWNAKAGRKYVRVEFPGERQEIEAALIQRLNPLKRNWNLGDTVSKLRQENEVHRTEVASGLE